ncbi:hypothetical protein T07_5089 [Trichinella nelsoni]|uniref:Uncharacterized protein n=1 Tax=Trichinella nelsoni TaxID=6336 RepID=A0A0V0S355_9BILA|nr:hypothetical protein T07_5089 [Trichinella nelsoni]
MRCSESVLVDWCCKPAVEFFQKNTITRIFCTVCSSYFSSKVASVEQKFSTIVVVIIPKGGALVVGSRQQTAVPNSPMAFAFRLDRRIRCRGAGPSAL